MVHGQPERDVTSSIMSYDSELIMLLVAHQFGKIIGHGTLGLLAMIISQSWFARLAIAAYVWADHGEPSRNQSGCDPVPGRRRPGMTMDKKYRRAVSTGPHPQLRLSEIDHLVGESVEHGHLRTGIALGPEVERACDSIGFPRSGNTSHDRMVLGDPAPYPHGV
jgi:hypothetical protein